MTAKSVIQIDVDDSKFREFHGLFQEYQKKLEGMPEDWAKVVGAIDDANDPMDHFSKSSKSSKEFMMIAAIQADAISKAMARATGVQDKFNTKAKDGAIQMTRMQKASAAMHKSISGMGSVLLKLGTVSASGIGSAIAAVYGATSALSKQNLQGRSLGLPIGRTQAFDANFGTKFGLDSSVLGSVQSMVGDPSAFATFATAGIDPMTTQNQDVDKLTFDLYRREVSQYRQWQKSGQNAAMMSRIMFPSSPFSVQQLNAGASHSDAELVQTWAKDQADAKKNAIDQGTADKASDVKAHLLSDWDQVANAFNDQLAKASPELQKMGDAAAAAAVSLIKVAGPQAKELLHALFDEPFAKPKDGKYPNTVAGGLAKMGYGLRDFFSGSSESMNNGTLGAPTLSAIIDSQYTVESARGKKLLSPKGAQGPMQFMPDTWKEWGRGNVNNLADSQDAARRYDSFLLKRYGGDVRKALAAYNWGMGNLDKDIAKNGQNWESHAPRETRDYIAKITQLMLRQGQNVNINITNSTAANVATSMNAAPH
ncbi:UNVERIFIED_ORG: Skp family chaperone for outer membrane proteins [Burkholderia sp. 1263]